MAKTTKTASVLESSALDLRAIAYELRSNEQIKMKVNELRPKEEKKGKRKATGASEDDYVEKKGFSLPAKALYSAYPGLKIFEPDLPLFRAYPLGQKTVGVQSLLLGAVYMPRQSFKEPLEKKMQLLNTQLKPLEGFEVLRYTVGMGMNASAVIGKDGNEFIITMLVSNDFVDRVIDKNQTDAFKANESYNGEPEAMGVPSLDVLGILPQKETLLFNLQEGAIYSVQAISGVSRKYETTLFDVVDEEGNLYPKVIANSALIKLVERHGMNAKFQIDSKEAITPSSNLQALLKKVVLKDCSPDAVALTLSVDDFLMA